MINIQIHVIHTEILKTRVDHVPDMLLTADARLDLFLRSGKELGGNDHIIPFCKIPQGSADILLTGAALIGDGRIIEIHAQLQPALYDLSGVLFVNGPAVLAPSGITESHAAHADPGYVQITVSKLFVVHWITSSAAVQVLFSSF